MSTPTRLAPPWHGTTDADGLLIDTPVIGAMAARSRVLARWQTGSELRELPDGRWVLTWPTPVGVRCELADGTPLQRRGDAWAPAGTPVEASPPAGVLRVYAAGSACDWLLAQLRPVDLADWVDLSALQRIALQPLMADPPPAAQLVAPDLPRADLRSAAKVLPPSKQGRAGARSLVEAATASQKAGRGARRTGSGAAKPPAWRVAWGELVMRTPAASLARGKHAAYLRRLSEAFEGKDYEAALRDAISLAGGGDRFFSLRLPRRRESLRWSNIAGGGGPTISYGPTVAEMLRTLYAAAAQDLERSGRIDEAAFVHVELLGNVESAVHLLERHRRYLLAAELAEGRELAAERVVRLLWLAGEREHAIAVARARGAYQTAIERLQQVDALAAQGLRAVWVDDLRAAGRFRAAVEAAWPDPSLQHAVATDIQAGMALGGTDAGSLLARLLAVHSTPGSEAAAVALAVTADPQLAPARDEFLETFATVTAADPAVDRRVATTALRALSDAEQLPPWSERDLRARRDSLAARCDPVLRADLLPLSWITRRDAGAPALHPPARVGELPVRDAIGLANGPILAACGDAGVRLLSASGATRARWDIPADHVIVADGGGSALLARADGGGTWELWHLDLLTRKTRRWQVLRAAALPTSLDGLALIVLDEQQRIVVIDAVSEQVRVVAKLSADAQVLELVRAPQHLAAVVHVPGWPGGDPRLERWQWDLPQGLLRSRRVLPADLDAVAVTADARLLGSVAGSAGARPAAAAGDTQQVTAMTIPPEAAYCWLRDGTAYGLGVFGDDATTVQVHQGNHTAEVRWPVGSLPRLRATGHLVTMSDDAGRIVVVDIARQTLRASFATTRG
jgi:hypothetical protein